MTGSFDCPELRDIQEKALVNFRDGGGGAAVCAEAPFADGSGEGLGLVLTAGGSAFEGDQGMKLLSDIFFVGAFSGTGGGASTGMLLA